jgi:cytochrome c oxidase subunit 2
MRIKKYLLILGIISLFLIAACSQEVETSTQVEDDHEHGVDDVHEDEEEHEETSMKVPVPGNEDVEEMVVVESANDVKEFDIIARQWEFEPAVIIVNKGDKVKLNIRSIDVAHGIAIPEFNVDVKFQAGEEASTEFTADKVGEFSLICNVYCGREHSSMRGTLIVN